MARYLLLEIPSLTLNSPPGTIGKEVTAARALNLCTVEKNIAQAFLENEKT